MSGRACPLGEQHTDPWGTPIPCPGHEGGLVVQPYRNDRGENAWVFRCWGTDTCDGWLSLDHSSEQSAERARDRHVAESHPELKLLRDMDDCRFCGEHEGSINHPGSEALAKGAPGHEYSPPTPEAPEKPSLLDEARATIESLRYQIRRAREALSSDEPFTGDRHPSLTAKLSSTPTEERLRAAEIRAAVAEHEAEAYRNQVQALVRELLRMREIPEEDLPQKVRVILLDEEAP